MSRYQPRDRIAAGADIGAGTLEDVYRPEAAGGLCAVG